MVGGGGPQGSKLWIQTLLKNPATRQRVTGLFFRKFDRTSSNQLEWEEAKAMGADLSLALGTTQPSDERFQAVFTACDDNKDGTLSKEEFTWFFSLLLEHSLACLQYEYPVGEPAAQQSRSLGGASASSSGAPAQRRVGTLELAAAPATPSAAPQPESGAEPKPEDQNLEVVAAPAGGVMLGMLLLLLL